MAKHPKDEMDEEEIIRRRDELSDPTSDHPPDAKLRRALADARLRALAFALDPDQSRAKSSVEDTDLLAYLLDELPQEQRAKLEETLRGDQRAFGQLMTLRLAFSSPTDRRDRHRADDPARFVPRHT